MTHRNKSRLWMSDCHSRPSGWNWRLLESGDQCGSISPTENKMQRCYFRMENLA